MSIPPVSASSYVQHNSCHRRFGALGPGRHGARSHHFEPADLVAYLLGSLRQGLWRIRKALEKRLPAGTQYVLADDLSVAFNPTSAYWLDALMLEGGSEGVESLGALSESLAVYRGELLPGFYDD